MKRLYQILTLTAITGLLTLSVANNADAQRGGGNHGGGGGGSHGGGGGGFSGGGNHGGGGFSGGGRPSGGQSFQGGGNRGGGQVMRSPGTQSYGGNRAQSFNNGGARGNFSYGGGNRGSIAYGGANRGPVTRAYGYGGFRGGNGYYRPGYGGGVRVGIGFNGGFYNHGGFYSRYYAPRLGFSLGILPYGYYPFYYGSDQYFYSGGYYYQHYNNQYTVVEPPVGAEVNDLPSNAQAINIDGQQYYEANGVYYLPITRDDGSTGYQIAGKDGQLSTGAGQQGNYQDQTYQGDQNYTPQGNQNYAPQNNNQNVLQPGEVVQALPPDTRKVKIDGQVYHVDPAGIYYHEERDQNGQKVYRVTDISQN